MMHLAAEAYEYQVKFSREGGLICLLIGVAIIAVLVAIVFLVLRGRK